MAVILAGPLAVRNEIEARQVLWHLWVPLGHSSRIVLWVLSVVYVLSTIDWIAAGPATYNAPQQATRAEWHDENL